MTRIEIKYKDNFHDGTAENLLHIIKEDTGISVDGVKIVRAYNINEELTDDQKMLLKNDLFCDPVFQEGACDFVYARQLSYDFAIEVAYKQGVTDNVGRTAAQGISYILGKKLPGSAVHSSTLYLFKGKMDPAQREHIGKDVLCNNLIEDLFIFTKETAGPINYFSEKHSPLAKPFYSQIDLHVPDEKLIKISDEGMLSLTLEEMKTIRDYYLKEETIQQRKNDGLPEGPTDVELEVFAQTWSEHCKHKIFAAAIEYKDGAETTRIDSLYKTFIKNSAYKIKEKRSDLLSLFKDNSGVVKFNDKYAYCVKAETHNSPSALDPYGGAMTGIVGVNRDILGTGMGAYPIFNTDIFCFGSPYTPDGSIPPGLLHPKRIFRGVHRGIKDGGNESGIPTVNGSITFDKTFLGKPLVFCGTGGILPLEVNGRAAYEKYVEPGHLIVMSGGRIGKDGIHGATFSSAHLSESSPTSAVQIGDPITQKKMIDFIIEARDKGLFSGLTDNGAGGLSSSIGEMAEFTNGAHLELDKCPLKYQGLKPWEILVSEAQERMSLAVPPEKLEELLKLSKKHDVESTVIGSFTDKGFFECTYKGDPVCSIDLQMLHEGLPRLDLKAEWKSPPETRIERIGQDFSQDLLDILARPNVASKESWVRMYDHEVGARTVVKPFAGKDNDGPSDGGVLKVFPDSNEGLVVTHGIIPRYSRFDTYHMAANAIDEAVRSAIILGANPDTLTGLDNFCWPDPVESEHTPDGKYKLAQLVRACQAVSDTTIAYNCPCISGKDSMKNDYRREGKKISVLPTLLFTVTGKIEDISKTTSFYFKHPGDKIYLIGATKAELGASEYYDMKAVQTGCVPKVEPEKAASVYKKIHNAIGKNLFVSAHDLSDGGLAVALAEAAFSGNTGCDVNLDALPAGLTDEEKLFSESPSRILVTVKAGNEAEFKAALGEENVFLLGETAKTDTLIISSQGKTLVEAELAQLKKRWKNALVF